MHREKSIKRGDLGEIVLKLNIANSWNHDGSKTNKLMMPVLIKAIIGIKIKWIMIQEFFQCSTSYLHKGT